MKNVNASLFIYGDGNFFRQAKELVEQHCLQNKVFFNGKFLPAELDLITAEASIGINLVEPFEKTQLLSLANKFFDYMQNGIPQLTMNFPEYQKINNQFQVALLIEDLTIEMISQSLNKMLEDEELYCRLQQNCLRARLVYNWQNEEKKLISFYEQFKIKTR